MHRTQTVVLSKLTDAAVTKTRFDNLIRAGSLVRDKPTYLFSETLKY